VQSDRAVEHWHRVPREVTDVPSLETFKPRSDGALSDLIWLEMSLLAAGGLDEGPLKVGTSQPKACYDSVIT